MSPAGGPLMSGSRIAAGFGIGKLTVPTVRPGASTSGFRASSTVAVDAHRLAHPVAQSSLLDAVIGVPHGARGGMLIITSTGGDDVEFGPPVFLNGLQNRLPGIAPAVDR